MRKSSPSRIWPATIATFWVPMVERFQRPPHRAPGRGGPKGKRGPGRLTPDRPDAPDAAQR